MCINHSNNKTSNVKKEIHLVFSSSSHLVNVSNLLPEIILNVCLLTSAIFQRCSDYRQNGCQAQRDHPVPPLDGTASTHDMECAIGVVSRSFYALYHMYLSPLSISLFFCLYISFVYISLSLSRNRPHLYVQSIWLAVVCRSVSLSECLYLCLSVLLSH